MLASKTSYPRFYKSGGVFLRLSALLLLAVPMYSVVKEVRICIKDPSAVPRFALQ